MSDVTNFIISDFSDIFEKAPVYNRLLNSLGMFLILKLFKVA